MPFLNLSINRSILSKRLFNNSITYLEETDMLGLMTLKYIFNSILTIYGIDTYSVLIGHFHVVQQPCITECYTDSHMCVLPVEI